MHLARHGFEPRLDETAENLDAAREFLKFLSIRGKAPNDALFRLSPGEVISANGYAKILGLKFAHYLGVTSSYAIANRIELGDLKPDDYYGINQHNMRKKLTQIGVSPGDMKKGFVEFVQSNS